MSSCKTCSGEAKFILQKYKLCTISPGTLHHNISKKTSGKLHKSPVTEVISGEGSQSRVAINMLTEEDKRTLRDAKTFYSTPIGESPLGVADPI
ncbi:Eukaryotic initiation factor 4A-I [Camelus dromedarius]|uniref:Eukaryotic initiation factor 4A-I n=1 Tax=Camelus dromedarius TaxID=9838 RepID=A0A5N4C9W5_CAMDR|nr:Eukaryotic initiation factor 4A-I [Camelus dromedarius]